MSIPESQLETWSHQGAVTTSSATYQSIQTALKADTSPIKDKVHEIYLQGSYKNDTNIRGDSDVDVVVQLSSTWGRDLSALSLKEVGLYEATYPKATYLWQYFRADVLRALRAYYGTAAVTEGNKSLKLARASGRLAADIVPALHYRKYKRFYGTNDYRYINGIKFHCRRDNRVIINYPKPHYANGVKKNSEAQTDGWYKPTVRVFKNARTYLVDRGVISETVAPSYFLECLIYNVPDEYFGESNQQTFVSVLAHLSSATFETFVCQNQQLPLFGNSPEQWTTANARQVVNALVRLWSNW